MTAKEQINRDILEAAQAAGQDLVTFVHEYLELDVPYRHIECYACDTPEIVKAWTNLQVEKKSSLVYHNSERLGEFIYDYAMYNFIRESPDVYNLRYIAQSGLQPIIPDGLISCESMFCNLVLPEGFTLDDNFDTSNITNMNSMFHNCNFPAGFTLGNNFDTSKVVDMYSMFAYCDLPDGFTLGSKFNTHMVKDMRYMFNDCTLPRGFTFNSSFEVPYDCNSDDMLLGCRLGKQLVLQPVRDIIERLKGGSQ